MELSQSTNTHCDITSIADISDNGMFTLLLKRIEQMVAEAPETEAICADEIFVSYSELWARSRVIAARIQHSVTEPQTPVALALARNADMVAAMLGILLTGRPYVPLDVELPTYKLAGIIDLVSPDLVICDQRHTALISGLCEARECTLLHINDLGSEAQLEPNVSTWSDEDVAYIIFTSGSTGTPKGIEMRAGALGNLMDWQFAHPRLGKGARTLMSTPISFDVSFQEIFGCLATGGTLVLVPELLRRDPAGLLRLIIDEDIERVYLPFVGVLQLAEAAAASGNWPGTLKDLVTAGEQLQITDVIAQFFSQLPGCVLHNHYGPAETHVVTTHELQGDPRSWSQLPPIGRPIANVDIRLLNEDGVLADTGEVGEIFIGGSCLARGYLKQPELTTDRFIADPQDPTGNARLYRSSDLGRVNENGELEWIGRNDNQVKVRGYRVELGEVELQLEGYPAVRKAVVVPRKRHGTSEIIAYLTADIDSPELTETALDSVDQWRDIWDSTYQQGDAGIDPIFNIAGWNSSYSGEPIAEVEMREWAAGIVSRVMELKPERVLEIGSGTGLLLFQIAPRVEKFIGVDFSHQAIAYVHRHLDKIPGLAEKVEVSCMAAHELDDFAPGSFDTIVMNSVTQHFPGADYLYEVLQKASELLTPDGCLFVGDITSRPLRRAFFGSVEREKISDSNIVADLMTNIEQRVQLDTDFTIDPSYFELLPAVLESIQSVEIQLKRGSYDNELINYRFDVILRRTADDAAPGDDREWISLPADLQLNCSGLVELASMGQRVTGIRNARLCNHWQAYSQMNALSPATVLSSLPQVNTLPVVDPEEIYRCAELSGIKIELRPSPDPQYFDLALSGRHGIENDAAVSSMELARHASDPLLRRRSQEFLPGLRRYVKQHLPDYMQPAGYMLVTSFPTTASGKVYRKALPPLNRQRPSLAQPYAAPKTQLECDIESIWKEVLDLDKAGLDDSFFDLGGNSLLSHELSIRLSTALKKQVSTLQIFSHPNIRALASVLHGGDDNQSDEISRQARSRGARQRGVYNSGKRPARKRNM